MPHFAPFPGIRYDRSRARLADVTAPPYDVIDAGERRRLTSRSPLNAVRIDLPVAEAGLDPYTVACHLYHGWLADGTLVEDPAPAYYGYRMRYVDALGRDRHTTGVIGALGLVRPGEGGVLPHERTTPKARSDRLTMLRTCRANLSPVWLLSLASGLTACCQPAGPPVERWVDDHDGVDHELWVIDDPATVASIGELVGSAPVVIADGHHRYETCLAYREERRAEVGPGPWDALMAFVVELVDDELEVHPIHRLLSGLPAGLDLVDALSGRFAVERLADGAGADDPVTLAERLAALGGLALLLPDGRWLLRPEPTRGPDADVDSGYLAAALDDLPPHTVGYHHSPVTVAARVASGEAQAGVLLRPVAVPRIADAARAGERMPAKTTFFAPKPRTGLVFRSLDAEG